MYIENIIKLCFIITANYQPKCFIAIKMLY